MKAGLICAFVVAIATVSVAGVTLEFPVASTNTGGARLNAGDTLVFDFSIDGSGNVTLDASTGATDPATTNTVNGWDGVVGSVADSSLFNTTFQLTASGKRAGAAGGISLDGYQGGQLGIFGQNASRIDGATLATPALEVLEWEITDGSPHLEITEWRYAANNNAGDSIVFDNDSSITNFNMAGGRGTNLLAGITLASGEVFGFTQPANGNQGFGLAGLAFDIAVAPPPLNLTTGVVDLVFSNSLSARVINAPIQLDFTVDGVGRVTLDASTSSADPAAVAAVDGWDGIVAVFTNPVVFNAGFSLTIDAARQNGSGAVNLSEVAGGGLAVSGQNSSRIDGGGLTPPNVETLKIIPSTGAAGVVFHTVSWNNSVNNVALTAAAGGVAATNLISSQPGSWVLNGFRASTGEALELSSASTGGYALAGLSFSLDVPNVTPRTNALPNIVVILADDLGYSDISFNPYHAPEVSTPNIDALIRSGIWFSDAYASGNICAPSRTGFLSGCYQQRIGVHREQDVNSSGFNAAFPYFPQHLKQPFDGAEDYTSMMVGKWHQGRDRKAVVSIDGNLNGLFNEDEFDYGYAVPETLKYNPLKRGFDRVYGFVDLGGSSYWNYGRGFFDQLYRNEVGAPIDGINDGDALETYMTTRYTEEACRFIQAQSASNKPFFLYLSYNAVHTPMDAPSTPAGLSEGDPGWFPDAAWYSSNYPNLWQTPAYFKPADLDTQVERDALQATRSTLMAMLYHMDQGIGQVIGCLETNGVRDDTIVVFWSDNGGAKASGASNNPLREQKHFNYEGGIRVPMSISWPAGLGAWSNTTVSAPVMSIDLLPTVLDAVDVEPANGFQALDGKSLLPLIRGETNAVHDALCWSEGGESGEYSIRQGDWKLYIDQDVYELYNLAADISETSDLSTTYPDKVREMRQRFFAWMSEMVDASGDVLSNRLWSTTTPPDGSPPIALQCIQVAAGTVSVEYDEKVGWLTNGVSYEATDALTHSWVPVVPQSVEWLDRFLNTATYRITFPVDRSQRFFRLGESN